MRIFPGWRSVGAAMRWARTNGATVTVRGFSQPHEFPDGTLAAYRAHRWARPGKSQSVTVGTYAGRSDPDMTVVNGDRRRDLYPQDGEHALLILAALDLIPAELAEVAQ